MTADEIRKKWSSYFRDQNVLVDDQMLECVKVEILVEIAAQLAEISKDIR